MISLSVIIFPVSQLMCLILDFANSPLLTFKSTGKKPHRGHVTETQYKPNITAAFEGDWRDDNTTLWPCIRLVGEQPSKEKSREQQRKQAMSYLHCLLLARPDLHVAQGLLTSKKRIHVSRRDWGSWHTSFLYPLGRRRRLQADVCLCLSTQVILGIHLTCQWFPISWKIW